MKTSREQVEEIRADKALMAQIRSEMEWIINDPESSYREKIDASDILLRMKEGDRCG